MSVQGFKSFDTEKETAALLLFLQQNDIFNHCKLEKHLGIRNRFFSKLLSGSTKTINPDIWIKILPELRKIGFNYSEDEYKLPIEKCEFHIKYPIELTENIIIERVFKYYNLSPELCINKTRKREVVLARQIVAYLLKSLLKYSLQKCADAVGLESHATVKHGIKTINNLIETSKPFKIEWDDIEKLFK